jgi:hypothetical protein
MVIRPHRTDWRERQRVCSIEALSHSGVSKDTTVVEVTLFRLDNETGQPINLVVSPRTQSASQNVLDQIRDAGGEIYRYDPRVGF